MPCTDGGVPYESAYDYRIVSRNNELASENDLLREAILKIVRDNPKVKFNISKKALALIAGAQAAHRKDDLKRLETVFRKSRDAEKLGLVLLANPAQELEPQLGFDPDEF